MKSRGLASTLIAFALLGAASHAQTPPPDPKLAEVRATLKLLDGALAPLRQGDYAKKDRRLVLPILVSLGKQLDALEPASAQAPSPRAADWSKLRKSAAETLSQEREFWAAFPDPDPDDDAILKASTAEALKARAAEISANFSSLFPERAVAGRLDASGAAAAAAAADEAGVPAQASRAVASGVSRGKAAADHPERFFDGDQDRGGQAAVSGADASAVRALRRPRPRTHAPTNEFASESAPSALVVPAPNLAAGEIETTPSWRPLPGAFRTLRGAAPDALRDAVRATPVLTGAAGVLTPAKPAAPPPSSKVSPAAPPPAVQSPETSACLQATEGHSSVADLCRSSPTIAPLLAGLLEALEEQFGTVQGLVVNLAYLLLGLVLSALSGFGLIAKVVVGLASLAMLVGTIYPLLKQGYDAVKELMNTDAGDVRHSRSLLSIGKLGGTVLIMALMAAIGYGVGKTETGHAAMSSATDAMSSKLSDLGLKDGLAALDAKLPASVKSFLGGPKPAEEASISGFGSSVESIPRSAKSAALVPEETLRANAALPSRAARVAAAMKQLGVSRAFAEKVADAHEQVPCAVGKCTPEELRRKLEIMGPGAPSAAAIRSGLAGGLPETAPALDLAPKDAAFFDERGERSLSDVGPAARPAVAFDVPAGKWDYFFGRVKARITDTMSRAEIAKQTHNADRSAQIARVLADNGIKDDPEGRALVMKLFREAASGPTLREVKTDRGLALIKTAELPTATLELSFYYAKDAAGRVNLQAPAVLTSIIPKEH